LDWSETRSVSQMKNRVAILSNDCGFAILSESTHNYFNWFYLPIKTDFILFLISIITNE